MGEIKMKFTSEDLMKTMGLQVGDRIKVTFKDDTIEEYEIIKLHPVIGETILASSETFKDALPLVRHHHERIDGRGYPDKLKGDEIPCLVKLISICDTFDAITSKRVYREKMTVEDALTEINRVKGAQLDIELSEEFIQFVRANADIINKIMAKKQQCIKQN